MPSHLETELAGALARLTPRQRAFVGHLWGEARGRVGRAAELAGFAWPSKQGSRLRWTAPIARVQALHLLLSRRRQSQEMRRGFARKARAELRAIDLREAAEDRRIDRMIADRMGDPKPEPPRRRKGRRPSPSPAVVSDGVL